MTTLTTLSNIEIAYLTKFYETGHNFPFSDNDKNLVILDYEWTPKYIINSQQYKTLKEIDDVIVVPKMYFPMYIKGIDINKFELYNLDIGIFISFFQRFQYWECDLNWLIDNTDVNKMVNYLYINRFYLNGYCDENLMELIIFISKIINKKQITTLDDFIEIINVEQYLPENFRKNLAPLIYNNKIIMEYLQMRKDLDQKYIELYKDAKLLKYFLFFMMSG